MIYCRKNVPVILLLSFILVKKREKDIKLIKFNIFFVWEQYLTKESSIFIKCWKSNFKLSNFKYTYTRQDILCINMKHLKCLIPIHWYVFYLISKCCGWPSSPKSIELIKRMSFSLVSFINKTFSFLRDKGLSKKQFIFQ